MMYVTTVCGPVAPEDLGFTSMHEHVLTSCSFYKEQYGEQLGEPLPSVFPCPEDEPIRIETLAYLRHSHFILSDDNWNLADEDLMAAEVGDFGKSGGGAILEVTPPGIGRNVQGLRRISKRTGVHIVASTGLYAEASWPDGLRDMTVDGWVSHMKEELEVGIEGRDIRAGHIKVAVNGITERQMEFLAAAARTSAETGASVTLHLGFECTEEDSRTAYKALLAGGMEPERLLMCHWGVQEMDLETLVKNHEAWKPKLDYAHEVLDQGINISFDCFGMPWDAEFIGSVKEWDPYKIAAIYALVGEGYGGQIVVGTDVFCKIMTRRYGGDGYCRLLNYVVPTLERLGLPRDDANRITVNNPARILAIG
jgi:phosphotriesterase-related protein